MGTFNYPHRRTLVTVVIGALLFQIICAAAGATDEEFEDFYTILEVDRHATSQEIKRAYRRLSLENHPDVASPSEAVAAAERFHKLSEAYEVLSKLAKRRLYDLYGKDFTLMEEYFEEVSRRGGTELYRYKKGVFLLYERNMEALLTHRPYTWILTFAQPGCGNCERNVPTFSRLGEKAMETKNIRLAIVNCLISNLCHYFGIDYLGQVFFLPPDQEGGGYWDKKEYNGPLMADRIFEAALAVPPPNMQEIDNEEEVTRKLSALAPAARPASLATVSSVDFGWLVDYYKPSCMPCRQTKSELRQISSELQDKLTISFVNCVYLVFPLPPRALPEDITKELAGYILKIRERVHVDYRKQRLQKETDSDLLFTLSNDTRRNDGSISQVPIDLRRATPGRAGAAASVVVAILTHLLHLPHQAHAGKSSQRAEEF